MKTPKKMKNNDHSEKNGPSSDDVLFLEGLTDLAERYGCRGTIEGEPKLPKAETLTLEQIAKLKVMWGSLDITALALKLGADPEKLVALNHAFRNVHGDQEHRKMNLLLSKYQRGIDQVNEHEPEKKPTRKQPRNTKN
ncbi:MAG: hypothetical protein AB7I18_08980 [Candidatus Berkiella sp.]